MAKKETADKKDWYHLDDAILIKAHLKGNSEAFEVLFKKHSGNVAKLAYSIVKDASLVEDIVQDVFLLIHRYLPKFRGQASFKTWVYRITVNEAVRQANKAKRWVSIADRDIEEVVPPPTLMIFNHGPSPERVLLEGEQRRIVHDALVALKPHHRAILSLYYLEDLPIAQIAEILEIPEGSVKSRLFYARANLKKLLDPIVGGDRSEQDKASHGL